LELVGLRFVVVEYRVVKIESVVLSFQCNVKCL
jgi:hypothetical protein